MEKKFVKLQTSIPGPKSIELLEQRGKQLAIILPCQLGGDVFGYQAKLSNLSDVS